MTIYLTSVIGPNDTILFEDSLIESDPNLGVEPERIREQIEETLERYDFEYDRVEVLVLEPKTQDAFDAAFETSLMTLGFTEDDGYIRDED